MKCPRAPFSWKLSAGSDKKSAICRLLLLGTFCSLGGRVITGGRKVGFMDTKHNVLMVLGWLRKGEGNFKNLGILGFY